MPDSTYVDVKDITVDARTLWARVRFCDEEKAIGNPFLLYVEDQLNGNDYLGVISISNEDIVNLDFRDFAYRLREHFSRIIGEGVYGDTVLSRSIDNMAKKFLKNMREYVFEYFSVSSIDEIFMFEPQIMSKNFSNVFA